MKVRITVKKGTVKPEYWGLNVGLAFQIAR